LWKHFIPSTERGSSSPSSPAGPKAPGSRRHRLAGRRRRRRLDTWRAATGSASPPFRVRTRESAAPSGYLPIPPRGTPPATSLWQWLTSPPVSPKPWVGGWPRSPAPSLLHGTDMWGIPLWGTLVRRIGARKGFKSFRALTRTRRAVGSFVSLSSSLSFQRRLFR